MQDGLWHKYMHVRGIFSAAHTRILVGLSLEHICMHTQIGTYVWHMIYVVDTCISICECTIHEYIGGYIIQCTNTHMQQTYEYTCPHMWTHMYTCTYMGTYMHVFVATLCMHICAHICAFTYAHIFVHAGLLRALRGQKTVYCPLCHRLCHLRTTKIPKQRLERAQVSGSRGLCWHFCLMNVSRAGGSGPGWVCPCYGAGSG